MQRRLLPRPLSLPRQRAARPSFGLRTGIKERQYARRDAGETEERDALSKSTITSRPISQSLSAARSRICTPFDTTQLSSLTLWVSQCRQCSPSERTIGQRTHFSPITTFSITTQLVSLLPLPMLALRPMMHRLMPTFSPRFGYTDACRCESGEMNTPEGVPVGGGAGGRRRRACERVTRQRVFHNA